MVVMAVADEVVKERQRLLRTLRAAGPDAATVGSAWTAADVAQHVAAQDRFFGAPAFLARNLLGRTGARLPKVDLDRPLVRLATNGRQRGWDACLRSLAHNPPKAVLHPSVSHLTLWEHFTHYEDVRRPCGLARDWVPDLTPVIPWLLKYQAPAFDGTALVLRGATGSEWRAGSGSGDPVEVAGDHSELVLWLSGRHAAADVEVRGDNETVAAITERLPI